MPISDKRLSTYSMPRHIAKPPWAFVHVTLLFYYYLKIEQLHIQSVLQVVKSS